MTGSDVPEWAESTVRIGTHVGAANSHRVEVRGFDLTGDLLGQVTYTEMLFLMLTGSKPTSAQVRALDATLVSLTDHGMQPSALIARLNYHVAPEAIQGAVASGLLGAGSLILGSMETAGHLLSDIVGAVGAGESDRDAVDRCVRTLVASGARVPGVGHALHTDGDPRALRLAEVASETGVGKHEMALMHLVADVAQEIAGRPLPVNVTGAGAAILVGLGIPWQLHRGIAMVSRLAGLLAHIDEERRQPLTPEIRRMLRNASWLEEAEVDA
jgi:citrate synthase